MKFGGKQLTAYGLGAIGKDMVYALSASFVMYYYQDLLHLPATFVGLILMIARVFDALNDPFMGVLVARTRTRFGKFRPWLFSGTVLNALVLYALFAAPELPEHSLMVYFSAVYILWGMTYTMMDIPYWSMIPAMTETPAEREKLSVVGRTCAGVGSALVQVGTMMLVGMLGGGSERSGFARIGLIIALVFVAAEVLLCLVVKEKRIEQTAVPSVKDMLRALVSNDQAMIVALTIVLVNGALYITSNLVIYFFKYDFFAAFMATETDWKGYYTLFTAVGGLCQILGMMAVYPIMRRRLSNTRIFYLVMLLNMLGYALILGLCFAGQSSGIIPLFGVRIPMVALPGILVFMASGILTVQTTVFLSGAVDYGEVKTGRREESVIFSMQTFVVKAASGVAVFIAGLGLDLIGLQGDTEETGEIIAQSAATISGLRMLMTLIPVALLISAVIVFRAKFKLHDEEVQRLAGELMAKRQGDGEQP